MTKQEENESLENLDKILTDIDVLESQDQNIFRVDSETFRFQKIDYKLIEDHQDAFDIEMMENRFSDYLLKYDYIVGDIAYEKLRLRGFYEDHRKGIPIDMKISNLEDYLVEYCNFGCKYFVFERVEKKKADPESYFKRNKKSNRGKKQTPVNKRTQSNKNRNPKNNRKNNKPQQKEFQVVKKEAEKSNNPQTKKPSNQSKPKQKDTKKQFEIRKKIEE